MSFEYPQSSLGQVAKVRSGFAFKSKDWQSAGIPVVKIANVKNGRLDMSGCSFVSEEVAQAAKGFILERGDILISMTGYVGDVARVRLDDLPCALNQRVGRFHSFKRDKIHPEFLFFHLRDGQTRREIEQRAYGSAQPNISAGGIEETQIYLPDLQTQKAIAHILGALDDKIELNQRMNETLEDIAKAIFKSWFVDFDPVRAKAEGRPTGLPAEISDLFPDAFEDSEIGEIPAGWKITSLGDQTTLTKGRSYKSAELMDSDTALVTLKSFHRGGGYRLDGLKSYTGTYKEDQVLEQGDLIIALTDVTQAADVIGKPAIVRSSSDYSTLVASLDVGIIRAKAHSDITREFCYFLMLTDRYTQHSLGYTTGTTVLHLAKDASAKFAIGLPHKAVIDHFTAIASPLMQRIFAAEKENEILAELRDTLLPKLISGELRIPDAEKFLAEAGI